MTSKLINTAAATVALAGAYLGAPSVNDNGSVSFGSSASAQAGDCLPAGQPRVSGDRRRGCSLPDNPTPPTTGNNNFAKANASQSVVFKNQAAANAAGSFLAASGCQDGVGVGAGVVVATLSVSFLHQNKECLMTNFASAVAATGVCGVPVAVDLMSRVFPEWRGAYSWASVAELRQMCFGEKNANYIVLKDGQIVDVKAGTAYNQKSGRTTRVRTYSAPKPAAGTVTPQQGLRVN